MSQPIHRIGHTLDLVISRKSETTKASTKVYPSTISDHHSILFSVRTTIHSPTGQERKTRYTRGLDITKFAADLSLALDYTDNAMSGDGLLTHYEQTIKTTLNAHAPLVSRIRQPRRCEPWYDEHTHNARQLAVRRANERRWRKIKLEVHRLIFVEHRSQVNSMIVKAKRAYYEGVLSAGEKKTCFAVVNRLLSSQDKKLRGASSIEELCQRFASFFQIKITLIREMIQYQPKQEGLLTMTDYHAAISQFEHKLQQLEPVTQEEFRKTVRQWMHVQNM